MKIGCDKDAEPGEPVADSQVRDTLEQVMAKLEEALRLSRAREEEAASRG